MRRAKLETPMFVTLSRSFRIECARRLPCLPADHPCSHVHGHSFVVELELEGEIDPEIGWLVDYHVIARLWQPLHDRLDHRYLNDVEGLANPTSELLARWIWDRMKPSLPELSAVNIMETPETRCIYRGR
jgi:6-pyruvoyltetrahydropterin/6-carboxytetrahydropterin synthase